MPYSRAIVTEVRKFTEPVTVTCGLCGSQDTISIKRRNDPRAPALHCDGPASKRHILVKMLGPAGEPHA